MEGLTETQIDTQQNSIRVEKYMTLMRDAEASNRLYTGWDRDNFIRSLVKRFVHEAHLFENITEMEVAMMNSENLSLLREIYARGHCSYLLVENPEKAFTLQGLLGTSSYGR